MVGIYSGRIGANTENKNDAQLGRVWKVDIVDKINLIRNGADRNEILLFRGQSDVAFKLIPSIGRNRRFACDTSIFNEERNLIEMVKFKLPEIFHDKLQPLNYWLCCNIMELQQGF